MINARYTAAYAFALSVLLLTGCSRHRTSTASATCALSNQPFSSGIGYFLSGAKDAAGVTISGSVGDTVATSAQASIIYSKGRFVVVGSTINSGAGTEIAIWRFNLDGTLDSTFGTNGIALTGSTGATGTTGGGESDLPFSIVEDSEGNLIVTDLSNKSTGGAELAVWRFSAAGVLDSTFGSGGVFTSGATGAAGASGISENDGGAAVRIDSSDRIVVAGYSVNSSGGSETALWRLTKSGQLDTSFGSNGIVLSGTTGAAGAIAGAEDDGANALLIDSQGRLLLAGYSANVGNGFELALWRFSADGVLDTTFGSNGIAISGAVGAAGATGGQEEDEGSSMAVDSQGRIVVAGISKDAGGHLKLSLWRYSSDGILDGSFGTNGNVVMSSTFFDGFDIVLNSLDGNPSLQIDAQGRLVVSGQYDLGSGSRAFIARLNSDGTADSSFATSGIFLSGTTGYAGATGTSINDYINSIQVACDGQIYAAGSSTNSTGQSEILALSLTDSGAINR